MSEVQVPESWPLLLPTLAEGPTYVVVIGAVDTGKSTFCRWLAEALAGNGDAWLIDADVGQSQLGPPATIGCGRVGSGRVSADGTFFVGDVSPGSSAAAYLGAFAAAAHAMRQAGPQRVVVDTTGWISGPDAVALKLAKATILGSAHIVLIERELELRAFRRAWHGLPAFPLHELRPAATVDRRPGDARRIFREAAFRRALDGAVECELDLREVAVSGARELEAQLPVLPCGLLVGLTDDRGRLLSIGILLRMERDTGKVTCLCRPEGAAAVEVRLGRLFLSPDGTHWPFPA